MRNKDEESARRVEHVSGMLAGACGVSIFSMALGAYFVADFTVFGPGLLLAAGLVSVTLLGGAVGAYTHSQSDDKVGYVLLWFPLPFVLMATFLTQFGLYMAPVLIVVCTMAGSARIVEKHSRQRK